MTFNPVYSQVIAGAGLGAALILSGLPHTLLLDRYRRVMAVYKDDKEEDELSPAIRTTIDKIMYAFDIRAKDEVNTVFFKCLGYVPVHKGSVKFKTGALIGLPEIISVSNLQGTNTDFLKIGGKIVDLDCKAGQELKKSLFLSDRAKAFAVAREISYAKSNYVHIDSIMKIGFGLFAYLTGFVLNNTFRMRKILKPFARGIIYVVIGCFFSFSYVTSVNSYFINLDFRMDKKVGQFSKELALGGVEYYDKVVQRNQALSSLGGSSSDVLTWDEDGNEMTMFSMHAFPSDRKDRLAKLLDTYDDYKRKETNFFSSAK